MPKDAELRQILELWESGVPKEHIAKMMGVSRYSVRNCIREYGTLAQFDALFRQAQSPNAALKETGAKQGRAAFGVRPGLPPLSQGARCCPHDEKREQATRTPYASRPRCPQELAKRRGVRSPSTAFSRSGNGLDHSTPSMLAEGANIITVL